MNIKMLLDHMVPITKQFLPALLAVSAPALMHILDMIVLTKLGKDAFMHALLVLPVVILLIQISSAALGGTITSATAKASVNEGHAHAVAAVRGGLMTSLVFAVAFVALFSLVSLAVMYWGPSQALSGATYEYGLSFCLFATVMWISNALAASLRGFSDFKSTMRHSWIVLILYCLMAAFVLKVAVNESETTQLRLAAIAFCLPYALILPVQLLALKRWCPLDELFGSAAPTTFRPMLRQAAIAAFVPLIANLTAQVLIAAFNLPNLKPALPILGMAMRIEYVLSILMFGLGTVAISVLARKLAQKAFVPASEAIIAVLVLAILVLTALLLPFFIKPDWIFGLLTLTNLEAEFVRPYTLFVVPTYYLYGTGLVLFFCLQAAQAAQFGLAATTLRFAAVASSLFVAYLLGVLSPTNAFQILGASFMLYSMLMLVFTRKVYARSLAM
jgi:Na+-driven multidrug efflux pump